MSHTHTHDQPETAEALPADEAAEELEFKTDPVADARRLLAQVEEARRQECAREITEVLARHGFVLQVSQPSVLLAPVRG